MKPCMFWIHTVMFLLVIFHFRSRSPIPLTQKSKSKLKPGIRELIEPSLEYLLWRQFFEDEAEIEALSAIIGSGDGIKQCSQNPEWNDDCPINVIHKVYGVS